MRSATPSALSSRVVVTVLLTLAVFGPAAFAAAEPGIHDGGMFFSEEALSEAADIVRVIRQAYDRDVVVETYAAVPDELREDLAREGKEKFYADWLERRAKELGVRGVFVLITREPGRVQVGVDRTTRQRVFTVKDREALREALVSSFQNRQFDQGLLEGLRLVRRRMDLNTSRDRNPSVPVLAAASVSYAPAGIGR